MFDFRPDGLLSRHFQSNPQPSLEWANSYEYNEQNQLVRIITEQGGSVIGTRVSEYDSDGRISRVFATGQSGNSRLAEEYSYGPGEIKKKVVHIDPQLTIGGCATLFGVDGTDAGYSAPGATSITSIFDALGRPAEHLFHDSSGELVGRLDFRYDERSNLVEEAFTYLNLPPELTANLNEQQKDALRKMFGRRHRYDARNRRIETSSNPAPADHDITTFGYNDHGDVISQVSDISHAEYDLSESGVLVQSPQPARSHRSETSFRYQYDSENNWVEKIVETPGGPVWSIERRSITYF